MYLVRVALYFLDSLLRIVGEGVRTQNKSWTCMVKRRRATGEIGISREAMSLVRIPLDIGEFPK